MAIDSPVWVNGQPANSLGTADRGLAYGHGLFETLRVCNGEAPLLPYHLERLNSGAQALGIPVDLASLEQQFTAFLNSQPASCTGAGVVKILLTAGTGGRGYQNPESLHPNTVLQWHPLLSQPSEPLQVRICHHRLPDNPPLAGHKHLNRLDQVIARQEWSDNGIHEGILLDTHGYLVEAVASNLLLWLGDHWATPKLHRCGVAGVMRRVILEQLCPALGVAVIERDILQDELAAADEMILCNSVQGIRPVVTVVGRSVNYQNDNQGQRLRRALEERYPCYCG